ncbi:hypothetical protein ACWOBH_08950 [Globicatella sanguinis]
MKNGKFFGLGLLLIVIAAVIGFSFLRSGQPDQVSITGLVGGEKINLLENTRVKEIAKKEYGLTYDYRKAGSVDMVQPGASDNFQYLFPSSQFAADLQEYLGGENQFSDIMFNTPIVLYSRHIVVDVLIKAGYVTEENGIYTVDMAKLANAMKEGKTWADIGLTDLYGDILVDTTNPNASNSGNMFLGLLANALNDNKAITKEQVAELKPVLKAIYNKIGYSQTSSSDLFNQFLKQGVGAYPIIAGYESQWLEFSKIEPNVYNQVKDDIVMLYPSPTVWSSHVLIGIDEGAEVMRKVMLDEEVQEIAWSQHGFRTIVSGTETDAYQDLPVVRKDIKSVMALPQADIMLELMEAVK